SMENTRLERGSLKASVIEAHRNAVAGWLNIEQSAIPQQYRLGVPNGLAELHFSRPDPGVSQCCFHAHPHSPLVFTDAFNSQIERVCSIQCVAAPSRVQAYALAIHAVVDR